MGLIARILGTEQLIEELRQERYHLLREVLRVSTQQSETSLRMASALEAMMQAYAHDGSKPEGRHINDEMEAEMFDGPDAVN